MKKKLLIAGGVILFLALVAFGGYQYRLLNKYHVTEFRGTVTQKGENSFTVKGWYFKEENPELQNFDQQREIEVVVTPETQISKLQIFLPTIKEVEATGGTYLVSTLPRETIPGSFSEINNTVIIRSEKNIYNRKRITAQSVEYEVRVFPKEELP